MFALSLAAVSPGAAADEVTLQVSPTIINPVIVPGDETSETITLTNLSGRELDVQGMVEMNPGGDESIEVGIEPAGMSIAAGQEQSVTLGITVDEDASAGSLKGRVLFKAAPLREQDVSISGQVAVNLDVDVIIPVDQVSFDSPHLVEAGSPVLFTARGRNNGRFPVRLTGGVDYSGLLVRDFSMTAESGELAVGESADMVLAWHETPAFSLGRVRLFLDSGAGAPVEEKAWLIIAPWRFLLVMAAVALALVAGMAAVPAIAKVLPPNWRKRH